MNKLHTTINYLNNRNCVYFVFGLHYYKLGTGYSMLGLVEHGFNIIFSMGLVWVWVE